MKYGSPFLPKNVGKMFTDEEEGQKLRKKYWLPINLVIYYMQLNVSMAIFFQTLLSLYLIKINLISIAYKL